MDADNDCNGRGSLDAKRTEAGLLKRLSAPAACLVKNFDEEQVGVGYSSHLVIS